MYQTDLLDGTHEVTLALSEASFLDMETIKWSKEA